MADLGAMRDAGGRGRPQPACSSVLEQASAARRALPARATRPENLAELRVPVPDREGVLAEITSLAGDLGINIYDIEIAHSAEGPAACSCWWWTAAGHSELRDGDPGAGDYRCTLAGALVSDRR